MNERKLFKDKSWNGNIKSNKEVKKTNDFKTIKNTILDSNNCHKAGITLIALVISIIVMLILAGVSLNATIGNNGIITQAQNATYMQDCAKLEEFLQSYYVSHFDILPQDCNSKIEALQSNSESASWFWMPKNNGFGGLNYVVSSDGKMCYFIDKANFESNSNSGITLKGGKAGNGTYKDYASFSDVYGVTSDLKVYYCSSGKDSILGIDNSQLDVDDKDREVFAEGSSFSKLIKNGEKVTVQDVKKVTTIDINGSSGVSLADLYNLTSLKKLTLTEYEGSLDGIQNAVQIEEIMLKNCTITNYSALKGIENKIKRMYLYNIDDNELNRFCADLSSANFSSLESFGIVGNLIYLNSMSSSFDREKSSRTITTTEPLSNLSETTKKAIKYMNLQNNNINSLIGLTDFSNIENLKVECNQLRTLQGIENMSNLKNLCAPNNNLGVDETSEKNTNTDALSYINSSVKFNFLHLQENQIKWIGYIKTQNALKNLYLSGNSKFDLASVAEIAEIYQRVIPSNKTINSTYLDYLVTPSNFSYKNLKETDTEKIAYLKNLETAKKDAVLYMDLSSSTLSNDELNTILKDYKNLNELNLTGCTKLTSFDFLNGKTNLQQICFSDTGITGNEVSKLDLYATNLRSFKCNNPDIDLTKMQKTISRSRIYYSKAGYTNYCGAGIENYDLKQQLSKCTEITYITTNSMNNTGVVDLTNCTKLTSGYFQDGGGTFILPSSITTIESWYQGVKLDFKNLQNKTIDHVPLGHLFQNWGFYKSELEQLANYKIRVNTLELDIRAGSYINDDILSYLNKIDIGCINFSGLSNQDNFKFVVSSWKDKLLNTTSIKMTGVNLENLEFLKENTNLTELSLIDCHISDISGIENCTNLKKLNLSGTTNGFSNLEPLKNMNLLEELNLNNCNGIYDSYNNVQNLEILADLHKNGALNTLYFGGNSSIIDWTPLTELGWQQKFGSFKK